MYGATGEFIIEIKSLKATSVVITVNGVGQWGQSR